MARLRPSAKDRDAAGRQMHQRIDRGERAADRFGRGAGALCSDRALALAPLRTCAMGRSTHWLAKPITPIVARRGPVQSPERAGERLYLGGAAHPHAPSRRGPPSSKEKPRAFRGAGLTDWQARHRPREQKRMTNDFKVEEAKPSVITVRHVGEGHRYLPRPAGRSEGRSREARPRAGR